MKQFVKIVFAILLVVGVSSCADKNSPNYQYMPNMYESVGYETYAGVENGLFPQGTEAMLPPANTISRNWLPFKYANSPEGKELARIMPSPLDSLNADENSVKGAELYAIYCAICHGVKGDGQGWLVGFLCLVLGFLNAPSTVEEAKEMVAAAHGDGHGGGHGEVASHGTEHEADYMAESGHTAATDSHGDEKTHGEGHDASHDAFSL